MREKNDRLIDAIKRRDQNRKSQFDSIVKCAKNSEKTISERDYEDKKTKEQTFTRKNYSNGEDDCSMNLKRVKIPLSKLVPISFNKLRERIRML